MIRVNVEAAILYAYSDCYLQKASSSLAVRVKVWAVESSSSTKSSTAFGMYAKKFDDESALLQWEAARYTTSLEHAGAKP